MANTSVTFISFENFVQNSIQAYQSKLGLSDSTINSAMLTLLETASQADFNNLSAQLAVLDSNDIDRASGAELDLQGGADDVTRLSANYASGPVTIVDSSFTKISTRIYTGLSSPIPGSVTLYVDDASAFPATGSIIIGRNTSAIETVPYSSVSNAGSYWQINLTSGVTQAHAQGASVILSQGGLRTVFAGASISTPLSAGIAQVTFSTNQTVQLQDGENTLTGLMVIATTTGSTGNIPANTLTAFATIPFPGATVSNPVTYTNGREVETDFDYRERIKEARSATKIGISQSIINGLIGLNSVDENKTILSATIVAGTSVQPTVVYIDDGTGYEAIYQDIGYETLLAAATGGEPFLQTQFYPISKARLVSFGTQPFNLSGGEVLSIFVGSTLSEHIFQATDFAFPGSASTYEVVTSINSDTTLIFSARTINNGAQVVLYAIPDANEQLLVTAPAFGVNANDFLVFPTLEQETMFLYKNNTLLTKDGNLAQLTSNPFPWNLPGSSYGLILSVDGTSNISVTFNSVNLSPYVPSNAPLDAWVNAYNSTVPGITAENQNNLLVIKSNKGADDKASITLDSVNSTLLANNQVFTNYSSTGATSDYLLRRGNGQIELATPAALGDNYTIGTPNFQAQILAADNTSGGVSVTYSGTPTGGRMWAIVDNQVSAVQLNITANISISVSNPSGPVWRYTDTSGVGAFANVKTGDIFITYDPVFNYSLTQNNQGGWYVSNCSSTWLEVEKLNGLAQTITLSSLLDTTVYRSPNAKLQMFPIATGNYSLLGAAQTLNADVLGATFDVFNGNQIRFQTNTPVTSGSLSLLAVDNAAQNLNMAVDIDQNNLPMHSAGVVSGNTDQGTPLFTEPILNATNTSNNFWSASGSITLYPDTMAGFLRQVSVTRLGQNIGSWSGIRDLVTASTSVTLVNKLQTNPFFVNDRFFNGKGYDFTGNDELFVIMDNSPTDERFSLNAYRNITVTATPAPNANSFSAVDADASNISLTLGFGSGFDFGNYRLWGPARGVVASDSANSGFVVKAAVTGPTGNFYKFGLEYPSSANQAVTYSVNTSSTLGSIDINVILPSSTLLTPNYDGTTTFNISTSGVISYNSGTTPNFLSMSVSTGTIVNISPATSFTTAAQGSFRVLSVSTTNFTVTNFSVSQSGAAINATSNMNFFNIATTATATNIVSFINTSLTPYLTAVLGVGQNGSGTINRIFSDFSSGSTQPAFSSNLMQLTDGENWVKTCSLTSSPQFTTERNFNITSSLYTLVGQQLQLIPYTNQQLVSFWNTPAFGSISNFGVVSEANQGNALSIKSLQYGSASAVQVEGGGANDVVGPVLNANTYLGGTYEKVIVPAGVTENLQSHGFVKFYNFTGLKKNLGLSSSTVFYTSAPATLGLSGGGVFQTQRATSIVSGTQFIVEKQQDFVAFNFTGNGTAPGLSSVTQGDFVKVAGSFSVQNQGLFRVVNSTTTTFWIENSSMTPEIVTCSSSTDLQFYSADSILPGDTLVVSAGVLGSQNDGTYEVLSSTTNSLQVVTSFPVSLTATPGSFFDNLQAFDQNPATFYKQIHTVTNQEPNLNGYGALILDNYIPQLQGKISEQAGFYVQGLNKLEFPNSVVFGINGYSVYSGLIKSAAQEVYGDPSNPTTYPGLLNPGANVDILPPLLKRIFLSIGIKLNTGVPTQSIEDSCQATVVGLINGTKIGQNLPYSAIIAALQAITGIKSVIFLSPIITSTNDAIEVTDTEKLIVLNNEDISIQILI